MKKRTLLLWCALAIACTHTFADGEPKTFNAPDGKNQEWVTKALYESHGQLGYVMLPADTPEDKQQTKALSNHRAVVEDKRTFVEEIVDGHKAIRRMTQVEMEQQAKLKLRAAADEHVFTGYTTEGVAMTFKVLSETDKTCQVGTNINNSSASWDDVAIDPNYEGIITIPSEVSGYTVTTIGSGAFYLCRKMKAINIPSTVKTINFCGFNDCSGLTELHIPASVESIDDFAFGGCAGLEKITVDASNGNFDSRDDCNAIIGKSYNDLILGCKNTVIPSTVNWISNGAFRSIAELREIIIPASVTWVGGQAFNGCYNLTSIKVDENNTALDSRDGCNAIIRKADNCLVTGCSATTIPETVTNIGYCAFAGQRLMESVTLPKSLTSMEERVFENCDALKKVVVWMPVPFAIKDDVFYNYGKFNSDASLYVPKGTKSAYQQTDGWSLFTSVYEMDKGPDDIIEDKDEFTATTVEGIEMKFKVLDRSAKTCQVGWHSDGGSYGSSHRCIEAGTSGKVTIPSEVNGYKVIKIAAAAFYYAYNVTEIVIPNTVSSIDDFAFANTSQMPALHLPASVTSISDYALADATGRTSIMVDAGNTVYDSRENCNAVIETATNKMIAGCAATTFPASVTALGQSTFFGCRDAKSFVISKSISSMGTQTFSYCDNLETLGVEEGNSAYDSREGSKAIIETATNTLVKGAGKSVIPESVVAIAYDAFEGNSVLEKVSIPAGITNMAYGAFAYCSNLEQVTSHIEKPFEISENVFMQYSNKYPEYLYVPAGTKAAYMATPAWNKFTSIVELDNEAQIDIAPLPSNETNFSKDMVDEKGDAIDLSNTKVDDVLFTLNTANGDGYSASEGCVVMNTPMTTEAVDALDMSKAGTPEFAAQFTGMVFAISAGRGIISINLQTIGQHTLSVKIGGGAAVKLSHPDKSTVNIDYNVESDTYVLVYAQAAETSAARRATAPADNSVKIYSIGWSRTGDYETAITIPTATKDSNEQSVYSIDGRKQKGEPSTKGIYIINGRKVVVK